MFSQRVLKVLGLVLVVCSGCGTHTPSGVYYGIGEWDRKTYLELGSDGTFYYSYKQKRQFGGTFAVMDGGISLIFQSGQGARLRCAGDTLIGDGRQMNSFVLWRNGKNGFEFEKSVDRVKAKKEEIFRGAFESDSLRIVAGFRYLDLLVQEGFMSRDEAENAKRITGSKP